MRAVLLILVFMISTAEAVMVHINDGQDHPYYDWREMVSINQTREYRANQKRCLKKFDQFASDLLPAVQNALGSDITIVDFNFCGIGDMDPGSYHIERFLSYCVDLKINGNETTGSLFFMTEGDTFCSGEEFRADKTVEIWIH